LEGEIRDHEIQNINDEIRAHVNKLNPSAGISDLSTVTTFNVAGDTMREAALRPAPYPEQTLRFIVAPRDDLFGMARMYEIVGDRTPAQLQVVRSREKALAALGAQNPKFERLDSH